MHRPMGWVGAVLSHRFGEESERPIAYASHTMAPAEEVLPFRQGGIGYNIWLKKVLSVFVWP